MPDISISLPAVIMGVAAQFFLGFVWYGILFRQVWMRVTDYDPAKRPSSSALLRSISLMLVANILMVWVLAHNIAAWNPVSWGLEASGPSAIVRAAMAAFFNWLGFIVPLLLGSLAWGKRSWCFVAINGGYYLVAIFLASAILTHLQ